MSAPGPRAASTVPARVPAVVLALAALTPAASALAANGTLPRTPVQHQDEHCLTVVDRSVEPVVHLRYTIPYPDVCLTADEPADSRTHQLLAFCRGAPDQRPIPRWHTRAELTADIAAGFGPPDPIFTRDVLEDSPDDAGCWHPIIGADERRPITCAAARPGVDWDTRGLPVGTYLVRGYTYEPPDSAWSPRHGLFKIVDDAADPAASPPAVAIANPVEGDRVRMTNYHWEFSIEQMRQRLKLDTLLVVNDFTALAMSLPRLDSQGMRQVGGGTPVARSVIGLLGSGSGLGVSGLIPAGDGWVSLGSEGGHTSMAPRDEREIVVLRHAWQQHAHVSFERLLSGPGLSLMHQALASREYQEQSAKSGTEATPMTPR